MKTNNETNLNNNWVALIGYQKSVADYKAEGYDTIEEIAVAVGKTAPSAQTYLGVLRKAGNVEKVIGYEGSNEVQMYRIVK